MTYCLKCKTNTGNEESRMLKTKNSRTVLLSNCAVCNSKILRFMKEQEAKGFLISLVLKTPLNKIPLLDEILF